MIRYRFAEAKNNDIVVDQFGVEFEIFLSKEGVKKGTPILAISKEQGMQYWLTMEGKYSVPTGTTYTPTENLFACKARVQYKAEQVVFYQKPVERVGWVNLYKLQKDLNKQYGSKIFESEEEAKIHAANCKSHIHLGTSKVTWME